MLGQTYEHAEVEGSFLEWVLSRNVLGADAVVIEWVSKNLFVHDDSNFAPVGRHVFSQLGESVQLVERG